MGRVKRNIDLLRFTLGGGNKEYTHSEILTVIANNNKNPVIVVLLVSLFWLQVIAMFVNI